VAFSEGGLIGRADLQAKRGRATEQAICTTNLAREKVLMALRWCSDWRGGELQAKPIHRNYVENLSKQLGNATCTVNLARERGTRY